GDIHSLGEQPTPSGVTSLPTAPRRRGRRPARAVASPAVRAPHLPRAARTRCIRAAVYSNRPASQPSHAVSSWSVLPNPAGPIALSPVFADRPPAIQVSAPRRQTAVRPPPGRE